MGQPGWVEVEAPTVTLRGLTWSPRTAAEDAPIALCLHGFPDTAHGWRHIGPKLACAGWRVVAPFMRGYAPSTIPVDGSYHIGALMDDATFAAVERAYDEHGVIFFRDQRITPEQQVAFTRRFGEIAFNIFGERWGVPGNPEMVVVSNITEDGKPIGIRRAGETEIIQPKRGPGHKREPPHRLRFE